jgi:quercetin dioxygenase-like cupin family protein
LTARPACCRPHTHRNDVWVQVLEGEVGVLVHDEVAHVAAGQWALKPRDVPHAMWNPSDTPARGHGGPHPRRFGL